MAKSIHSIAVLLSVSLIVCLSIAKEECSFINNVNKFSMKLSEATFRNSSGNLICSPFSIFLMLLVTGVYASTETAQQIESAIYLYPDRHNIACVQNHLFFLKRYNTDEFNYTHSGDIYFPKDMKINSDFLDISDRFLSRNQFVNYENLTELIVENVKEKNNFEIEEFSNDFSFFNNTRMVLVRTESFTQMWGKRREIHNTIGHFYLNDGTVKNVTMMETTWYYLHSILPDYSAEFITLYDDSLSTTGEHICTTIILPYENSTTEDFDPRKINLERLKSSRQVKKMHLIMPKFEIKTTLNLKTGLSQLNLGNLFKNLSNFKDITTSHEKLFFGNVIQHGFLQFNEEFINLRVTSIVEITDETENDNEDEEETENLSEVDEDSFTTDLPDESHAAITFNVSRPFYIIIENKNTIIYTGRISDIN